MCRCYGRRISPAYGKRHTSWQRAAALTGGVTSGRSAQPIIYRTRIRRGRVVALLALAALVAALAHQVPATSTAPTAERVPAAEHRPPRAESADPSRALGPADGAIPDGTTAFDDDIPGVARLDPVLLDAVRRAAADAAGEGVALRVDSGWRSREYQQHLLDDAIAKYGSHTEAARWVAPPDRSSHVSGDAVDVGPQDAAAWLSQRGASYGLCQTYANEPWHFELRTQAAVEGCPAMYADPTHDPRLQP
jgi:hypothetical protein